MSEKSLNQTNIRAVLEQMGSEAVPERMQRHRLADPGGLGRPT